MPKITRYLDFAKENPRLFGGDGPLEIILDEDRLRTWESENGAELGIVSESGFNLLVRDLVKGDDGRLFGYERVLSPSGSSLRGAVCATRCGSKYLLHQIYRHAPRAWRLEMPRGFAEPGERGMDVAARELAEEAGLAGCRASRLGHVECDTGLVGGGAEIWLVEADREPSAVTAGARDEGIERYVLVDSAELLGLVRSGVLTDGYSLSAIALLLSKDML